jgi:hypothetical protein
MARHWQPRCIGFAHPFADEEGGDGRRARPTIAAGPRGDGGGPALHMGRVPGCRREAPGRADSGCGRIRGGASSGEARPRPEARAWQQFRPWGGGYAGTGEAEGWPPRGPWSQSWATRRPPDERGALWEVKAGRRGCPLEAQSERSSHSPGESQAARRRERPRHRGSLGARARGPLRPRCVPREGGAGRRRWDLAAQRGGRCSRPRVEPEGSRRPA